MAEKKKKVRIKRLYEYARDYTVSPDGEVHYHGLLYDFEDGSCQLLFRRFLFFSSVSTVLLVVSGLLPVVSMRFSPFVIFPYGIALVFSFILLVSCVRAVRASLPMDRRTFDTSFGRFLPVSVVLGVCSVVMFFGHLIYLLTHLFLGIILADVIFAVAQICVAALSVIIFLRTRSIRYRSYDA